MFAMVFQRMELVEGSEGAAAQRNAGEGPLHSEIPSWTACTNADAVGGTPTGTHACTEGSADPLPPRPLQLLAAVPIVARNEAMPEAAVSTRFEELQVGAAVAASFDVGACSLTEQKRRHKQLLAIQWYCGCCKQSYMSRTMTMCRECGVPMVSESPHNEVDMLRLKSRRSRQKRVGLSQLGLTEVVAVERQAGVFGARRMDKTLATSDSTRYDCVCVLLQGELNLVHVRL